MLAANARPRPLRYPTRPPRKRWTNPTGSGNASSWIDCVGVLNQVTTRGYKFANVLRFGESNPTLRTSSRISDLAPTDLRAFCDWEACTQTSGYSHLCWVDDAGVERCRVCDGGADCAGNPMSEDDCVAHATDTGRATCHVGLLQECLIQRALRGPADPRVTISCALAMQSCAGVIPGDLSAQALAAQNETNQVTIEVMWRFLNILAQTEPDAEAYTISHYGQVLASWEGGLPDGDLPGIIDAGDGGD